MKIDILRVTQCGLRNKGQVDEMITFVQNGGRFNEDALDLYCQDNPGSYRSPLIRLAQFPDEELFIADGHHRILSVKLGGRDFLYEDEYRVVDWTYQEYLEINFKDNWVTPFDPRTNFRYPDFLTFKKAVKAALKVSEGQALKYIQEHPHLYMEEKRYEDIISLGEDEGLV